VRPAETVHDVRVGALTAPQTGVPGAVGAGTVPLVDDVLQLTVAVPSLMVTLVPVHNEAVKLPDGETVSADAMWVVSPSTAASAGTTRKPRIRVAFITVTPVGGRMTRRRDRKGIEKSGVVWVFHSI